METYTVLIQQEFYGVRAPDAASAARQVEDLVKSGGHSPYMKIFVGDYVIRMSPIDKVVKMSG